MKITMKMKITGTGYGSTIWNTVRKKTVDNKRLLMKFI